MRRTRRSGSALRAGWRRNDAEACRCRRRCGRGRSGRAGATAPKPVATPTISASAHSASSPRRCSSPSGSGRVARAGGGLVGVASMATCGGRNWPGRDKPWGRDVNRSRERPFPANFTTPAGRAGASSGPSGFAWRTPSTERGRAVGYSGAPRVSGTRASWQARLCVSPSGPRQDCLPLSVPPSGASAPL